MPSATRSHTCRFPPSTAAASGPITSKSAPTGKLNVQVFPNVESMIELVGAVMAECDEDWSFRHAIASMDLLEKAAAPKPAIGEEAAAMAERPVPVAMESAGMPGKAA